MRALIRVLAGWVHRYMSRIFFYVVVVTGISIVTDWLIGGTAAMIAGKMQFIALVIWIYIVQIYLMFTPDVADEGWFIALLPFPVRVGLLVITTIVSGHAITFTAVNMMHQWLGGS